MIQTIFNYRANIQQQKAFVKGSAIIFSILKSNKIENTLTIKMIIVKIRTRYFGGFCGLPPQNYIH